MIDFYFFKIDTTTVVAIISAIIAILLQLLLCFKVKNLFLKLIPVLLLAISTIVFVVLGANVNGWEALGYLLLALLSFALLVVCGIVLGVWAIVKKTRKK